jgi:hypothetical protein
MFWCYDKRVVPAVECADMRLERWTLLLVGGPRARSPVVSLLTPNLVNKDLRSVLLTKYSSGNQLKKIKMSRECSTNGVEYKLVQDFSGKT